MKVNTHGRKMSGLRKAAGETKSLTGCYDQHYVQISYNRSTGDVFADYLNQGNFACYDNNAVIVVCRAHDPMTMQEIADAVDNRILWIE